MTDEEYRKKQRLLIIFFTLGAIAILTVFVLTLRSHFADLRINNPIDEIVDEDDVQEIDQIRRSINELNQDLEEFQSQSEGENSGNGSSVQQQQLIPQSESSGGGQMDPQQDSQLNEAEPSDVNEFLRQ
jgi:hypothetical protein